MSRYSDFKNPKGILAFSPGLRGTSYPRFAVQRCINPNGVASFGRPERHNPVGVEIQLAAVTQGSSFLATLGCRTQSRWDCRIVSVRIHSNATKRSDCNVRDQLSEAHRLLLPLPGGEGWEGERHTYFFLSAST